MGFKMTATVRLVGIEHKIEALNPSYKKLSLETLILTDTGNRDLTKIRESPETTAVVLVAWFVCDIAHEDHIALASAISRSQCSW